MRATITLLVLLPFNPHDLHQESEVSATAGATESDHIAMMNWRGRYPVQIRIHSKFTKDEAAAFVKAFEHLSNRLTDHYISEDDRQLFTVPAQTSDVARRAAALAKRSFIGANGGEVDDPKAAFPGLAADAAVMTSVYWALDTIDLAIRTRHIGERAKPIFINHITTFKDKSVIAKANQRKKGLPRISKAAETEVLRFQVSSTHAATHLHEPDYLAGVFLHEMLHRVGLRHTNGRRGTLIRALQIAVSGNERPVPN